MKRGARMIGIVALLIVSAIVGQGMLTGWHDHQEEQVTIEKGFVGVVKSNVHTAVNIGDINIAKPTDCTPTVASHDVGDGEFSVSIVPIGCKGIWQKPLPPGHYRIWKDDFKVLIFDTRVQTMEWSIPK